MIILIKIGLFIAIGLLALPVGILLTQVLAALTSSKNVAIKTDKIRPRLAILMPAHNESLIIAETIKNLLPALNSTDQLLIVADNCSDQTAEIARQYGSTVIERQHPTLRGKGYALDFGLQHLKKNPPEVVIIIDADCTVDAEAISKLTNACMQFKRPIQALYLMQSQPNPSLKERIAEFAWVIKNKVRPLGFKVLGLPCQLMGTGMAFLWTDLTSVNLASGHIAEDMKLGVDFARLNKSPVFLPEALVTSIFPSDQAAIKTQRARWEHGHLGVILTEAPKLFLQAIKSKNLQMLGLAFDLIVPPLAVLVLLCSLVLVVSFVIHQIVAIDLVLMCAGLLLAILISAILIAWIFFGRDIINFRQLCYAPIYALSKVPLYIRFFVNRQVEWVRSKRD